MKTQMMIMLIVGGILLLVMAMLLWLVAWLGWLGGLVAGLAVMATVIGFYTWVIKPWHMKWGATEGEVARRMPGDELIPGAGSATRAITVEARPEDIWPWLVQLGYGKAGWYSYDWIDNDFQRSAERIVPEYQHLAVGDKILMMPGMGFVVRSVDMPNSIVSVLEDGSTSWCLGLYPGQDGATRLISRWRPKFERSVGTFLMLFLTEPGTFIMEQKMLRSIRDRVEAATTS